MKIPTKRSKSYAKGETSLRKTKAFFIVLSVILVLAATVLLLEKSRTSSTTNILNCKKYKEKDAKVMTDDLGNRKPVGRLIMPKQSLTERVQWLNDIQEKINNPIKYEVISKIDSPNSFTCEEIIVNDNVDFLSLLKHTCGSTRLRFSVNGHAVTFTLENHENQ